MREHANKPLRETVLITKGAPFSFVEAFRGLRTNLQFAGIDNPVKTMVVTSSIPGEGKTTVAINLALILGQIHQKVLLVDTDLRKPMIHRYLHIRNMNRAGVTAALAGQQSIEDSILFLDELGIYVMPAGPSVPNPADMLQSKMMASLVAELRKTYSYIVFDAPPVSVVSDAAVLAPMTDGLIVVLRQKYTALDEALATQKWLENVDARVLGCVFNAYSPEKSNHFTTRYYKDYSDYGKE